MSTPSRKSNVSWLSIIELHDAMVTEIRKDPLEKSKIEQRFYRQFPYLKPQELDKLEIKGSRNSVYSKEEVLSFQKVAIEMSGSEGSRKLRRLIVQNSELIVTGKRRIDPLHIKVPDGNGGVLFITYPPDEAYIKLRNAALMSILLTKCFDIYLVAFSQKCTYLEARKLVLLDSVTRLIDLQPFILEFVLEGLQPKLSAAIEDLTNELTLKVIGRMGVKLKDPSFFLKLSQSAKEGKKRTEAFKSPGKRGRGRNNEARFNDLKKALKDSMNQNKKITKTAVGLVAFNGDNPIRDVNKILERACISWEEFKELGKKK
jgi:hypothetical protein